MNAAVIQTMRAFGYPETAVFETDHWAVLTRPKQPTLGSMVLVCRDPAKSLAQISAAAFAEMKAMTSGIEAALRALFAHDKINYLALMMVDPDVHFHVLPRYAKGREFAGIACTDPGWPAAPNLGHDIGLPAAALAQLTQALRRHWPKA